MITNQRMVVYNNHKTLPGLFMDQFMVEIVLGDYSEHPGIIQGFSAHLLSETEFTLVKEGSPSQLRSSKHVSRGTIWSHRYGSIQVCAHSEADDGAYRCGSKQDNSIVTAKSSHIAGKLPPPIK